MEQALESGAEFAQRYVIEELVGAGDRKFVYRARDNVMGRTVALAVLREGPVGDDSVQREAILMGLLSESPHIVTVYDVNGDSGGGFIVSQYMAGGDLRAYLEKRNADGQQLAVDEVLRIADEICQAVSFVHDHGLIHRDVSPGNLWLDGSGRVHLGDFDSAVALHDQQLESTGLITTEGYMAPELAIGSYVDERSDLYSLGATLYELATGEKPEIDEDGRFRRACELRPDLPSALDELICDLLAASPSARPASAAAVREALAAVQLTADLDSVIAKGENDHVEFKSSLRCPHGPEPVDAAADRARWLSDTYSRLQREVAKAIAAFLNSEGGTLIVGVSDDGQVLGIEHDFETLNQKKNLDGWSLAFQQTVSNYLGRDASGCLSLSFTRKGDATVAVVRCTRRGVPTWLREGKTEALHVRFGTSSAALSPSEAAAYIADHWS